MLASVTVIKPIQVGRRPSSSGYSGDRGDTGRRPLPYGSTMSKTTKSTYAFPAVETALQTHKRIRGVHDVCNSVEPMSAEEFDRLVHSIEQSGLLTPVLVDPEGYLLDGRSRLCALHVLGIPISDQMFETTVLPPRLFEQLNRAGRHLTKGQLIMVANELLKAERREGTKLPAGAKLPKQFQMNPVATSPVAPGRNATALDTVPKSDGQPRERLQHAESLRKNDTELAKQVDNRERDWDADIENHGLSKPESNAKKSSITSECEHDLGKPSEPPVDSGLSPNELMALRHLSDQLLKQAALGDVTRIIRDYLRECCDEDRPDHHPSLRQLALYCQCDVERLRHVAWADYFWLELEAVGVILALAGVYPACTSLGLTETRIIRSQIAAEWLANEHDNGLPLSTYLTQEIVTSHERAANCGADNLRTATGM